MPLVVWSDERLEDLAEVRRVARLWRFSFDAVLSERYAYSRCSFDAYSEEGSKVTFLLSLASLYYPLMILHPGRNLTMAELYYKREHAMQYVRGVELGRVANLLNAWSELWSGIHMELGLLSYDYLDITSQNAPWDLNYMILFKLITTFTL